MKPHLALWDLVRGRPQVDPQDLAMALDAELQRHDHDVRTQLLIRDSFNSLVGRWGQQRAWASLSPRAKDVLPGVLENAPDEPGFPTLQRRLMEKLDPATVLSFLRELGSRLKEPARVEIGGSMALILQGLLSRSIDVVDVVDAIPPVIRREHDLLHELAGRYGLQLTHFQSHYLPDGWKQRLKSLGSFGPLEVMLIDPYDIFLGKLFSVRTKDRDDLRVMLPQVDRQVLHERFTRTTASFRNDAKLAEAAANNWYILFGEALPM